LHTESIDIRIYTSSYDKLDASFAPSNEEIWTFFQSLVNVRDLSIYSPRLSYIILAPEPALPIFPNLTKLYLHSRFSDFDDPFDLSHYTPLSHYANLDTFYLSVERSSSSVKPLSQPRSPFPSMLSKLTDITLRGPLTTCRASVAQFVNSHDSLKSIRLDDLSVSSRLFEIVSGFSVQPQLWGLEFERFVTQSFPPRDNIADAFAKFSRLFPNLGYLRICGECDSSSPSFYDALGTLSLEYLSFEQGADPSLQELTKLICSGKMDKMVEITFDNVEGERGNEIEEPYDEDELDGLEEPPHWIVPKWTEEFDEAGLIRFMEVAKREGIEVTGSATEAFDIEREYEEEKEKLDELQYERNERLADLDRREELMSCW